MDLWIGFIKICSMVATGLFGALGLLTKYKDETGRITRWGKTALIGILASSVFSMALYVLETTKAREASEQAQKRAQAVETNLKDILVTAQTTVDKTETLRGSLNTSLTEQKKNLEISENLAKQMKISIASQSATLETAQEIAVRSNIALLELDRMRYPLSNLGAIAFLRVSIDHPEFDRFRPRFESQVQGWMQSYKARGGVSVTFEEDGVVLNAERGQPIDIQIMDERIIRDYPELGALIGGMFLRCEFFKSTPDLARLPLSKADSTFFYISYSFLPVTERGDSTLKTGQLHYNITERAFLLYGVERRPMQLVETSRNFISALDLTGSTLVVSSNVPGGDYIDKNVSLIEMAFLTSLDQRIIVPGEKAKLHRFGNQNVFVYHFPDRTDSLFTGKSKLLN